MGKAFTEAWWLEYQAKMAAYAAASPSMPSYSKTDITDQEVLSAYFQTKSVHKAGKLCGVTGDTIHQRLKKLGFKLSFPCTPAEEEVLRRDYDRAAELGKIADLAKLMDRPLIFVHRNARRLGLTKMVGRSKPWVKGLLDGREDEFSAIHNSRTDKELGAHFGVTFSSIVQWRKKLGLTKDMTNRWVNTPHPRGALGMTHSLAARETISARSKAMWEDPDHRVNSDEFRQLRSDLSSAARVAGLITNSGYSRTKSGRRGDLNDRFFRSSWEANYARYLNFLIKNRSIHKWEYEAVTFWFESIKRGTRSYTPDFRIWETAGSSPYFVEIKGWMDPKSLVKLSRMARFFPNEKIVVVGAKEYYSLARSISKIIPFWENGSSSSYKATIAQLQLF